MPRLDLGRYLSEPTYSLFIQQAIAEKKVGGFCIFNGSAAQAKEIIDTLRELSGPRQLLFSIDAEWGATMRLSGEVTEFPHARAIAESTYPDAAFLAGSAIGEELKEIGLDWNFAPVLDINSDPENPIINIRSFGESPDVVIEKASAFSRGLLSAGILSSGKHFPGHGETKTDSHTSLPVLKIDRQVFFDRELKPFIGMMHEGIPSIMTGHLAAPMLARSFGASDEEAMLPATLSPFLIRRLLRETLGYEGVVVTDSLEMASVKALTGSDAISCELALRAGCDVLLMPTDLDEAFAHLLRVAENDYQFCGLVQRAYERVAALHSRIGREKHQFSIGNHQALANDIARRAIHVEGEPRLLKNIRYVVLATNDPSGEKRLSLLREELGRLKPGLVYLTTKELPASAASETAICYAQRPIGKLMDAQESRDSGAEFLGKYGSFASCIFLVGNPYLPKNFIPSEKCIVRTFSDSTPSIRALGAFIKEVGE